MEPRSRRRGKNLESAILDAAWAELLEVGYAKVTMESVANRAGTSKPVLYRRWPSRAELVLAAWRQRLPVEVELPDTGSLGADLKELLGRLLLRFRDVPPDILTGLTTETFRDPDVLALLRAQLANSSPWSSVAALVARAVARGELPPVRLSARVVALPLDLIRTEAVLYHREITERTIEEIVDDVFLPLLRGLAETTDRPG